MNDESRSLDPYESVLADLRCRRDQIDQTIRLLEAVRAAPSTAVAIGLPTPGGGMELAPADKADSASLFLGMSLPDAAKKLLSIRRKALTSAEIASAIQAGGMMMRSADPINTIGSVLTRRFNIVGDIVRVSRGVWGLAEWYPNRNFKRKNGKLEGDTAKNASNAPEQLSGSGKTDPFS